MEALSELSELTVRDWLYVIGLLGFGLLTITAVFWPLVAYVGSVRNEQVEVSWLTPPRTNDEESSDEESSELADVGRRVHSQVLVVAGRSVRNEAA